MIELEVNGNINAKEVMSGDVDEIERNLQNELSTAITKELMIHIDNMAFIDLKLDEQAQLFHYEASLVLCSKQDIITNSAQMAVKLADYGLNQEQILDVLETQTQDNGGF